MAITLKQIRNQILKNIYEVGFVKNPAEEIYQAALRQHFSYLPQLSVTDQEIVEKINQEGVAISSLTDLLIPQSEQLLEAALGIMPDIPNSLKEENREYVVHATSQQIMSYPEIFLWGLEERLLNIVETYLGLPVAYHGAYFRRDIANQVEYKSRLWHIDVEDRKILKVIIYLHDIDEKSGPFEYLSRDVTTKAVRSLKYKHGYIQDETMQRIVSSDCYKPCLGVRGTVILAATSNIFHRGKLPETNDRFAIFYDYTSRSPKMPFYCKSSLDNEDLIALSHRFSPKQKQCVFWRS
ncbi:MAG: 2OG-Fe(II) oxygenase [Cyanobacteria bacterium P01_A01_bin.84]